MKYEINVEREAVTEVCLHECRNAMVFSTVLILLTLTVTSTLADAFDEINFTEDNVANFHQLFVSLLQNLGFSSTPGLLQQGDPNPLALLEQLTQNITSSNTLLPAVTDNTPATRAIFDAPTRRCRTGQSRDVLGNCRDVF
ncbi:hypothetical protein J6590_090183 [Homalodisca vitripennis]|nr:hypothetical protein J6590_090183 [Homalodisca vitripennis]